MCLHRKQKMTVKERKVDQSQIEKNVRTEQT